MTRSRLNGLFSVAIAAMPASGAAFGVPGAAQAGKYTILHRFGGAEHGENPTAAPVRDTDGNLYGTTSNGGTGDEGTVWKLTPDGKKTVLHSFGVSEDDGTDPRTAVTLDDKGNIFGTTVTGGTNGNGIVYRIKRNGAYDVLYNFHGTDGGVPLSRLILDSDGNLYGTTNIGGADGGGTVYKLAPDGILTVLYSFAGGADGTAPDGDLARDSKGDLFGTTQSGGDIGCGTLFKLTPSGTKSVLHHFNCDRSGAFPKGVIRNATTGDIFGVASQGGEAGFGVAYRLSVDRIMHVMHVFDDCCGDGANPTGGLSMDNKYLYGMTGAGGAHEVGTVFRVAISDGAESLLHSFAGGHDGQQPLGGLRLSGKYLYGTTFMGGQGAGTIFRIKK